MKYLELNLGGTEITITVHLTQRVLSDQCKLQGCLSKGGPLVSRAGHMTFCPERGGSLLVLVIQSHLGRRTGEMAPKYQGNNVDT